MARIEWVEARLLVWARWRVARGMGGMGVMGYAGVDLGAADSARSGYREAAVPLMDVEASETEACVQLLNPRGLMLTVFEHYCGQGGVVDKAKRLCCAVPTVYTRIDQAHQQLAVSIQERQRRAADERARVQGLQLQQRAYFPR